MQVGRWGAFCAGLQIVPNTSPANGKRVSIGDIIDGAPQATSYAISYSPDGAVNGRSTSRACAPQERNLRDRFVNPHFTHM